MTYNVSMGTLNPTIPYHTSYVVNPLALTGYLGLVGFVEMNIICLVISWKKLVLVQHIIHFIELFMPKTRKVVLFSKRVNVTVVLT